MLLARLAPAVDGIRVALHVIAAAVWVGGQITLAGLVPPARRLGEDGPRLLAQAFARLSWPAYAVLVGTGIWNVAAVSKGQPDVWNEALAAKVAVVVLAGLAAWLHGRTRDRRSLAVWGAITASASTAALVLGVFLAG